MYVKDIFIHRYTGKDTARVVTGKDTARVIIIMATTRVTCGKDTFTRLGKDTVKEKGLKEPCIYIPTLTYLHTYIHMNILILMVGEDSFKERLGIVRISPYG